jgi:hypothetical protein
VEAVKLGLADALGDDTAAIEKAASLAGITNYELVDVNTEVDRLFVQKIRRIFASSDRGERDLDLADALALRYWSQGNGNPPNLLSRLEHGGDPAGALELRKHLVSGILSETQEDPLPGFPLDINRPNIYYIYAGQAP